MRLSVSQIETNCELFQLLLCDFSAVDDDSALRVFTLAAAAAAAAAAVEFKHSRRQCKIPESFINRPGPKNHYDWIRFVHVGENKPELDYFDEAGVVCFVALLLRFSVFSFVSSSISSFLRLSIASLLIQVVLVAEREQAKRI